MSDQPPRLVVPGLSRRLLVGAGATGALGLAAALRSGGLSRSPAGQPGATPTPNPLAGVSFSTSGWQTDFSRHNVPLTEITPGGPSRDGIPPIDAPRYVPIADADAWLEATEPVIAVAEEVAGQSGQIAARAYPLQIMVWHEIVNDILGGQPRLVTFCPLCNTAIAFDRRLDPSDPNATVYDFGTTGNLRGSDLVMWDRQSESWWQQITGEAIVGALTGSRLTPIPAQIVGWSAFKAAYPDGDVLSKETGFSRSYGQNPYVGYDDIDSSPFLFDGRTDDRLPPMERVVGLVLDAEAVAYPLPALAAARAVNDEVAGQPVAILFAPGARSALDTAAIAQGRDVGQAGVFVRARDDRVLTFRGEGDDHFADEETGTVWDVTGLALSGPLAGNRLAGLPHTVVFWFAWAAFQPATRLWSP